MDKFQNINLCYRWLRAHLNYLPHIGIILGSGWDILDNDFEVTQEIPYQRIPYFPRPTIVGHQGKLILCKLGKTPLAILSGRVHLYEGYTAGEVVRPVRALGLLGIKTLIVTNSAGAINPRFRPGEIMLITDHINLMWANPLRGKHDNRLGLRFPDLCDCYNPQLINQSFEIGRRLARQGIKLHKGVYLAVTGPSYETPAEIRMFGKIGADAVGMSTVPEVLAARQMGINVLGISCLVNQAAGLGSRLLEHSAVLKMANQVKPHLKLLIKEIIRKI